jgi:hypothetical protein
MKKPREVYWPSKSKCLWCKKVVAQKGTCSKECARHLRLEKYGLPNDIFLPTGTTGAISELEVVIMFLNRGFSVFRSVSPSSPFDLVVYDPTNNETLKVEVKTTYRNVSTSNITIPKHYNNLYDLFVLYIRNDDKFKIYNNKGDEITSKFIK